MVSMDFKTALLDVLLLEGDYSNRPLDLGGETNKGITQNEFDIFNTTHGKPWKSVKDITSNEVSLIYELDFWDRAGCDQLCDMNKSNLAYILFNISVQRGFSRAVSMLQEILSIAPQTGHFGPLTNKACVVSDEMALINSLLYSMQRHYYDEVEKIPDQITNLHGWLNRLDAMAKTVNSSFKAS
jgi:lysozyme family protein